MSEQEFHNPFSFPARWPSMPRFAFDEAATTSAGDVAPVAAPAPGATSAPAASPGAPDGGPSPGGSPAAGATSSDPFAGFDSGYGDLGDDVIEIPAAPAADAGAQVPGAQPAPVATPAPAAQPQAAPPSAEPAPSAAPAPSSGTPASPTDQLSAAIEGFKTHGKELSAFAAQNLFKLSEEDATALATNAEEVIPRLMGQVYNQALAAAGNLIRNFVPQMIEQGVAQITTKAERSKEAINEFWASNPDLNAKDHGADVQKWSRVFRQANPTSSRKEAIAFVAKMIRVERGLAAPGAPSAARQAAFTPARPGGAQPPPSAEHDPYAGMALDFDSQ